MTTAITTDNGSIEHEDHFESMHQQAHAARLGMWVFLATEVLLFGVAFTVLLTYQAQHPLAFREAVQHNTKLHGTVNTAVLLASSTLVAGAVHALRAGLRRLTAVLVAGTITLALAFLVIKAIEYRLHFAEGIFPGGIGAFFDAPRPRGTAEFWTLYYGMTGLHAIHVTIGVFVLGALLIGVLQRHVTPKNSHRLDIGAIYWHLVDVIWIFLWPLFYLV